MQGDWRASIRLHPLGMVMLGLLFAWPLAEWRSEQLTEERAAQLRLRAMLSLVLFFLLVWLLRLVDFLPSPL